MHPHYGFVSSTYVGNNVGIKQVQQIYGTNIHHQQVPFYSQHSNYSSLHPHQQRNHLYSYPHSQQQPQPQPPPQQQPHSQQQQQQQQGINNVGSECLDRKERNTNGKWSVSIRRLKRKEKRKEKRVELFLVRSRRF